MEKLLLLYTKVFVELQTGVERCTLSEMSWII